MPELGVLDYYWRIIEKIDLIKMCLKKGGIFELRKEDNGSDVDIKSSVAINLKRLYNWLLMAGILILAPPMIAIIALLMLELVSEFFRSEVSEKVLFGVFSDMSLILLAFYSGVVGSISRYIVKKSNKPISIIPANIKLANFTLGGVFGIISFFAIKSPAILKFIYPKINIDITTGDLSYQSIILFAVIFGILGSKIVSAIESKIANKSG